MSDEVDRAEHNQSVILDAAVKRRRDVSAVPVMGIGRCHACGDRVDEGRRWCDADCRDDWEKGERWEG